MIKQSLEPPTQSESSFSYDSKKEPLVVETRQSNIKRNHEGTVTNVNEYSVVKFLGRGSFAEVYLCERKTSFFAVKEKFAIKCFNKSILRKKKLILRRSGRMIVSTAFDKVEQEVAIMKKLIHPNLVQLYEVIDDSEQDSLYMILEYVDGGPVMDYIEEEAVFRSRLTGGVIPEHTAASYIRDIIDGLAYLHLNHICHRDLKPENILLTQNGMCKIADFGVAHYFEDEEKAIPKSLRHIQRSESRGQLTKTEGTWVFWAPEMCQKRSFSGYSVDMWAVGICLFVFIFGKLPFVADSPPDLFEIIQHQQLVLPSETSIELSDILHGLLNKDHTVRFTITEITEHPWMIKYCSLSVKNVPTSYPVVSVSKEDVERAFAPRKSFVLLGYKKKKVMVDEDDETKDDAMELKVVPNQRAAACCTIF